MRYELLQRYYDSPEYRAKLQARIETLKMCDDEPLNVQRLAIERWSVDPIEFIEQFGWVQIPEFGNEVKPFFLFEYQRRVIRKLWEAELSGEDVELLVDKPRGMGLTWLFVWYEVWRWLFSPRWGVLNLSRTESEVDAGDFDPNSSIFGKIRWAIQMLPGFLMPEGFAPKGKKGTSTDMMLKITNPKISSVIAGSTTNSNAGRGRRYSMVAIDECFAIEHFNSVYRALQSVARVKLFVSTVKSGKVFQDFKSMCEAQGNYVSLTWRDHPFKDEIWYQEQLAKAEFDPEVMKEVEVDYAVSIKSQYYPEVRQAKTMPVQYQRGKPVYVSLDFGQQDKTVIVWWQFDGQFFKILECVSNSRRPLEWYAPFLNPSLQENPDHYTGRYREILDRVRTWERPVGYFGEAAHFQKVMPLNVSIADELYKKYHVRLICNNNAIKHPPRRAATVEILPRTIFNSESDGAMELYDSIANSRYKNSVRSTSETAALAPVHDEYADHRAAFENGAVNFPRILRAQRSEIHQSVKTNGVRNLIKYLKA